MNQAERPSFGMAFLLSFDHQLRDCRNTCPCFFVHFSQETHMQNRIVGTTMPVLEFILDHNECIISEAGELS